MDLIKRDGFYWQTDIIAACQEAHGDKYDYSLLEEKYTSLKAKLPIICHKKNILGEEHGLFYQPIVRHLSGRNCPKCMGKKSRMSDEEVIARAKAVHGDKYEYTSVERDEKGVLIINAICHCKDENGVEHGVFKQTFGHHVRGKQDCPKCRYVKSSAAIRRPLEEVIKLSREIHGDAYDYSLIGKYKNDRIKYPIKCKKHNTIFYQTFN
ncbi:MAG: hypothetical protein K2M17_05670, partial [Bacilli bacterium]|nr:hypothetical protein [Bacilli bacterium]